MTKIPTQDTKVKELRINYPKVKVDAIEGRQCLPINAGRKEILTLHFTSLTRVN